MTSLRDLAEKIKLPSPQWERLRHPHAGILRIALLLLLPFILWHHAYLLIVLWLMAAISHPLWFPEYIESTGNAPLLTRLVDLFRLWLENTATRNKIASLLPGALMILPMLCALWAHLFFWSLYFYIAAATCKIMFLNRLLNHKE